LPAAFETFTTISALLPAKLPSARLSSSSAWRWGISLELSPSEKEEKRFEDQRADVISTA